MTKISLKNPQEIAICREGGRLLAKIMVELGAVLRPGIKTNAIEQLAMRLIKQNGLQSSFKGYKGYPKAVCVSVNDEVVHGIPSNRLLKRGDIVGLDLGIIYQGFHLDMAKTIPLRPISAEANHLLLTTKKSLDKALSLVKPGVFLGDISWTIQNVVESAGLAVVRDLTGHGIGRKLQEEPAIPNFGCRGEGPVLKPGMLLAIEPMVTMGSPKVKVAKDGWTVVTLDHSLSAHFEHTVAVTATGHEVLTKL